MIKKYIVPLVLTLVIALNLGLGLSRLGNYSSVDEPYWTYGRTSKFWNAIKAHKWKSTDINDKPGITVAILSGIGLTQYQPMDYKSLRGEVKTDTQLSDINNINFDFRLPIYLFCVILLPLFYFLLRKLFDETTALLGFIFIGLSPILLGISLIINPDSLFWIFLPLSLLSYLVFQKNENKRYLWLSGILFGFSLLTKYVANILYIIFFLLPFMDYIFNKEKPLLTKYIKTAAKKYLTIVLISMITFFIFYPATWKNIDVLLKGTFLSVAFEKTWPLFALTIAFIAADIFMFKNKVTGFILAFIFKYKNLIIRTASIIFLASCLFVLADVYLGMKPFNFEAIIASPKGIGQGTIIAKYSGAILADVYGLIFGISPLILTGIFAALCFSITSKRQYSEETKIVFYFTFFILLYYLASSVNDVIATVRYQIAMYPLALIIGAIGIGQIASLDILKKYYPKILFIILALAFSISSLLMIRPFYFAYASSLLPQDYLVNLKDMGDGSFEAAEYLNSLPNPEKLVIWSDKGAVCAVFKGKCLIGFTKKIKSVRFDYLVTSSGRKSRTLKLSNGVNDYLDFAKAYETEDFAKKIIIGQRENNYVKIIEAEKIYK